MVTRIEMQIINWILLLKMQKREPPHTEVTNQSVKITRIKLLKYLDLRRIHSESDSSTASISQTQLMTELSKVTASSLL